MGEGGLEPPHLAVPDPKSGASTDSATRPLRRALEQEPKGVQAKNAKGVLEAVHALYVRRRISWLPRAGRRVTSWGS